MKDRWAEFRCERYDIQDQGRMFIFLVPSKKLKNKFGLGTIEDTLRLLIKNYVGAFTYPLVPYAGEWTAPQGETSYDECREYRIAFLGKERIPLLLDVLAAVAKEMDEKCIFVGAGQYFATVSPKEKAKSLTELLAQM